MKTLWKSFIIVFVLTIFCLPMAAAGVDTKRVIDVTYVNVNGDRQGFLALVAKGRAIAQKIAAKR